MTDQEINIAIAQACGWHTFGLWNGNAKQVAAYPPDESRSKIIPNYCRDLNAMHEAEDELDGLSVNTKSIYYDYLLLGVSEFWEHKDSGFKREPFNRDWAVLRSTSRQRAEAFLRCKGLWREA
jgi:hypothetical protein